MSEEKKEIEEIVVDVDSATELSAAEIEAEEALIVKADRVKEKHKVKKVFFIEVEDEDTGEWIGAWLRKPKLMEFSMFTKMSEKDNLQALKTLITSIFLEGDRRIYEDDDFFMGAISQVQDIVNVQRSKIKKF